MSNHNRERRSRGVVRAEASRRTPLEVLLHREMAKQYGLVPMENNQPGTRRAAIVATYPEPPKYAGGATQPDCYTVSDVLLGPVKYATQRHTYRETV